MANAPEEIQEQAAEAQQFFETGAAAAGVAAAVGISTPLAGPFVVLGALMGAASLIARRWAEDPPRDDYAARTRIPRSPVDLDMLPGGPIAAEIHLCATHLIRTHALLAAGLLAFEREQGAALAGAERALAARYRERRAYVHEAVRALVGTSHALHTLARAMELRGPDVAGQAARLSSDDRDLPAPLLAGLYRVGLPIAMLRRVLAITEQRHRVVVTQERRLESFRGLGESLVSLSVTFDEWDGEPAVVEDSDPDRPGGSPDDAAAFEDGPYATS